MPEDLCSVAIRKRRYSHVCGAVYPNLPISIQTRLERSEVFFSRILEVHGNMYVFNAKVLENAFFLNDRVFQDAPWSEVDDNFVSGVANQLEL